MGCCLSGTSTRNNRPKDTDILGRRDDVCCTDVIYAIVFIIFLIGMTSMTIYAYHAGDIRRVTNNHDCFGNICGKEYNQKLLPNNINSGINTTDKPFVYHTYSNFWPYSRSICVKKCPNKYLSTYSEVKQFAIEEDSKLCTYDYPIDKIDSKDHKQGLKERDYWKSQCAIIPVKPQIDLLGFCITANFTQLKRISKFNEIGGINNAKPFITSIVRDFIVTWVDIVFLSLGSLGLSLIMIFLIRYLASAVVYVILILTIFATVGLSTFLWLCYASQEKLISLQLIDKIGLLIGEVFNTRSFFYMALVSTIITVIVLLVIGVMWKRVQVVTELFAEASRCIGHIPQLLIVPVCTFVLLSIYLLYWFTTFGFLMSVADFEINNRTGCVDYPVATYPQYLVIYFLIGLIWISEFLLAGQQMVIAGTVAQWYFQRNSKSKEIQWPLCKSFLRCVFQHSGSLAKGSLIITAVRLPRWALMYLSKKLRPSEASGSPDQCCARCLTGCCVGCLYCLEKCLKYLNKNAYAIIAIEGCNFCQAATRAFTLLLSNVLRVAALNSVGDFILFLGKLSVAFLSAGAATVVFMRRDDLYFYPLPILVVAIVAYFFAHCILSLYETVLDVFLICFCVEEEALQLPGDAMDAVARGDIAAGGDEDDDNTAARSGLVMKRSQSHLNLKNNIVNANTKLNIASGHANATATVRV